MDLNTPIFAISRLAGWAAHVIEEKFAEAAPKPALYRPKAVYVGKYCGPQGCEYKPLDLRPEPNSAAYFLEFNQAFSFELTSCL